jgi:hypothetical protein
LIIILNLIPPDNYRYRSIGLFENEDALSEFETAKKIACTGIAPTCCLPNFEYTEIEKW